MFTLEWKSASEGVRRAPKESLPLTGQIVFVRGGFISSHHPFDDLDNMYKVCLAIFFGEKEEQGGSSGYHPGDGFEDITAMAEYWAVEWSPVPKEIEEVATQLWTQVQRLCPGSPRTFFKTADGTLERFSLADQRVQEQRWNRFSELVGWAGIDVPDIDDTVLSDDDIRAIIQTLEEITARLMCVDSL